MSDTGDSLSCRGKAIYKEKFDSCCLVFSTLLPCKDRGPQWTEAVQSDNTALFAFSGVLILAKGVSLRFWPLENLCETKSASLERLALFLAASRVYLP